jgi:trigger factor
MSSDTTELKVAVQETESWTRRLTITVPAARVQRTRGAVAAQIISSARLPGFRKGKLPTRIVEQRYGPSIDQETVDRTIQEAYREALETEGIIPITQGKVDNVAYDAGADLRFEVEFDVRPEIELNRISGFSATRPTSDVSDEDVESVLDRLRDERAGWEPLDEGVKPAEGDQVVVEITARDDAGQPKEGEEARTYRFVIGEGQAIPQVEEAILTLAEGEEGEFTVRFPDDFPDESRRDQEQHLLIRVTEARKKVLPELNDEFAQGIGDFESVEALRARILQDLQEDAEKRADSEVRRQLVEQILEANPFQAPSSMVDRYLDYMTGQSDEDGKARARSPEEEEQVAKVREALRPQAEWGMKRMMVVERLAETKGLTATQDEVDAKVEEIAERHGRSPSEVWIQLEKSGQLETLEREITEDKVFEYLKSQNAVQE